jgi:glycosyltransferase involved in cell wall biosynthesis
MDFTMEKSLKATVITPSFNNGSFIEKAILSVKYQSYPHIEHIVADGGSKDGTVEILKKYDKDIRWFSEPDRGFADAVNKALKLASGQVINILNSDDTYFCEDAVTLAMNSFVENPSAGIVFGDYAVINENDQVLDVKVGHGNNYSFESLILSNFAFPQNSAFIRREAIDSTGGELDLEADWCADFDLWIAIGLRYPITYVPFVLSTYRRHTSQRNADITYTTFNNPTARRYVLEKLYGHTTLAYPYRRLKKRAVSETYWRQVNALIQNGKVSEAFVPFILAIRNNPELLISRKILRLGKYLTLNVLLGKNQKTSSLTVAVQSPDNEEREIIQWWNKNI